MTSLPRRYIVIDCQTSHSSPSAGQMIELAWSVFDEKNGADPVVSHLIKLREGTSIHQRILSLTGIAKEDLETAALEDEVLTALEAIIQPGDVFVAHYARFETSFIKPLLMEVSPDFLCTYEIARRLFPDLPSRSIRAVSGYLGLQLEEAKRAAHHVEATIHIWTALLEKLTSSGIDSYEKLSALLAAPPPKRTKKTYCVSSEMRLTLPDQPGIYKMLGHDGRILYVGKATSLKSRVNSYFRGQKTKGSRLNELVTQIAKIDHYVTASPFEAALLESDLIKTHNPPYNRAQKSGNRAIGFVDFALAPTTAMEQSCFGPFGSKSFVEQTALLKCLVDSFNIITASQESLVAPEFFGPSELTKSVLLEGIILFRNSYAVLTNDQIDWNKTLCKSWVESIHRTRQRRLEAQLAEEEDTEDEDDESVEDLEHEWTPEQVASFIAKSFAGFARRIHRARWLNRLANATVVWIDKKTDKKHAIRIRNGAYLYGDETTPPQPATRQGATFRTPTVVDLRTFDRLQVLFTEVRRLIKEGHDLNIDYDDGGSLDRSKIMRYMFTGDFDEGD